MPDFGGTKLGRGGLIRAYGGTAGALIDQASVAILKECQTLDLHLDYGDQGRVQAVLRSFDLTPNREDFAERIHLEVSVPLEQLDAFREQLLDRTAGRLIPVKMNRLKGEP